MKSYSLCFLSLFFLILACNDANKKSSKESIPIISTDENLNAETIEETNVSSVLDGIWILTKLNKITIKNKTSTKNPTLHIDVSDETIMGNGGCNEYSGEIHFVGQKQVEIEAVRATKVACKNSRLERNYFNALSEGTLTYMVDDKLLTMYREGVTMVFEKAD